MLRYSLQWSDLIAAVADFEATWGPVPENLSQHSLDLQVVDRLQDLRRLQVLGASPKARLLAAMDPFSGHWLRALPSPQLGTMLDPHTLRIDASMRLGLPVCAPHPCARCTAPVSSTGDHALSCSRSLGRHSRHEELNSMLSRALQTAGFPNNNNNKALLRYGIDALTISRYYQRIFDMYKFTRGNSASFALKDSVEGQPTM